jgi:hypothetical protein
MADFTLDAESFLSESIDGELATVREVVPEGDYQAMLEPFEDIEKILRTNEFTYKAGPNAGQPGSITSLDLTMNILDPDLLAKMGREKVTVRAQCTLDFTPQGKLDTGPGKNILLGQIRAAVGQNKPGHSLRDLSGAGPVLIRVKHRSDKNDSSIKYAEVRTVAPV